MADIGSGWTSLHASHEALQVNNDKRHAIGDINTNQMESFPSRLRRLEIGTHHHIAGPYLVNYASVAAGAKLTAASMTGRERWRCWARG